MPFSDRRDAGHRLAAELSRSRIDAPVVLALPRGGVPTAYEVARRLGAPLDVLVVRKLGCPGRPELGVGAIGEDGVRLLNRELMHYCGVTEEDLAPVVEAEENELARRLARYREGRPATPLAGRTAVVVDDGIATGFTARAAIEVVRHRGASKVLLAVPVAPADTVAELSTVVDELVCLESPSWFTAIGAFYDDFSPTSDDEVAQLLGDAARRVEASDRPVVHRTVEIAPSAGIRLPGELVDLGPSSGVVLFAHGSGSSRHSPRNQSVAAALQAGGLSTLLFDLLTPEEGADRSRVFDIGLLAERLVAATRWIRAEAPGKRSIGYFGASTGAAAALVAAAQLGDDVSAVVSRGGRPDLAAAKLAEVTAPTLLIVGSRDPVVLELNQQARRQLRCPSRLEVVPGATHLFEEEGALEAVAHAAQAWFREHLAAERGRAGTATTGRKGMRARGGRRRR
jgi:putative phosphoribosyl transferase